MHWQHIRMDARLANKLRRACPVPLLHHINPASPLAPLLLQALLAKHGRRLFGVESRRPLDEFDVLGFSLSYELGGTNILEMLKQAGVPATWEVRLLALSK
jgi:hypothetical protein